MLGGGSSSCSWPPGCRGGLGLGQTHLRQGRTWCLVLRPLPHPQLGKKNPSPVGGLSGAVSAGHPEALRMAKPCSDCACGQGPARGTVHLGSRAPGKGSAAPEAPQRGRGTSALARNDCSETQCSALRVCVSGVGTTWTRQAAGGQSDRTRAIFHLQPHSPDAHNGQGWAGRS